MNKFFEGIVDKYFTYFNSKYVNKLKNLELALKVALILIFGLFGLVIFMVNYSIKASNEKTIEITLTKDTLSDGSKYRVERDSASKNYYETIAYGVLHELTTYDYTTIQNKVNYALELVHPSKYTEVYEILSKESEFVVANRVNQEFSIKEWIFKQIDESTVEIKAVGYLTRKVGGLVVVDHKKYTSSIVLKQSGGLPFVMGLDLNYADRQKEANEREERQKTIDNYDKKDYEGMKNDKPKQ